MRDWLVLLWVREESEPELERENVFLRRARKGIVVSLMRLLLKGQLCPGLAGLENCVELLAMGVGDDDYLVHRTSLDDRCVVQFLAGSATLLQIVEGF